MTPNEPPPSRWRQRAAVLFCAVVIAAIWGAAQSDWAFGNRVMRAGGYLNADSTAPDWIRDTFGEGVAVMFDTPRELYLRKEIPDGLLERAAEIESLHWLVLDFSDVTDEELAVFTGHAELRGLRLDGTSISDRSLAVFESLPKLKSIHLRGSLVSPAGLAAFRQARPRVEVEIDPATEAGLAPYVRARRASFSPLESQNSLTITGPPDRGLLDAAEQLTFSRLCLTDLTADADIARLVAGRQLQEVELTGVELSAETAAAFGACPLRELRLSNLRLTADAARGLASLSLDRLQLERVTFEAGAPQALHGLQTTSLVVSGEIECEPGDRFESLRADSLALQNVTLRSDAAPFHGVQSRALSVKQSTLPATATAVLAAIPEASLSLEDVEIAGEDDAWPAACRAGEVWLRNMTLRPIDARALAALPLDRLSIADIDWRDGSGAALADLHAASLTIDRITRTQARALGTSLVSRLWITEPVSVDVVRELVAGARWSSLRLEIEDATSDDVEAVITLPELTHCELALLNPPNPQEVASGAWRTLAGRRADLDLRVSMQRFFPGGSAHNRLWPDSLSTRPPAQAETAGGE